MAATSEHATADQPDRRSRLRELVRNPVVAGTALALISGLIASVLLPAMTASWQDRPRELALKRELVADVAEASTNAVAGGNSFAYSTELAKTPKAERIKHLTRALNDWEVASSVIGSQLATYFGESTLPLQWAAYQSAVSNYIEFTTQANPSYDAGLAGALIQHFRSVHFDDPRHEQEHKEILAEYKGKEAAILDGDDLNRIQGLRLLGYERDQLASRILEEDATGFSHGVWFIGD